MRVTMGNGQMLTQVPIAQSAQISALNRLGRGVLLTRAVTIFIEELVLELSPEGLLRFRDVPLRMGASGLL